MREGEEGVITGGEEKKAEDLGDGKPKRDEGWRKRQKVERSYPPDGSFKNTNNSRSLLLATLQEGGLLQKEGVLIYNYEELLRKFILINHIESEGHPQIR